MKNFINIFNKFKGIDAVVLMSASNTFYLAEYENTFAFIILSKQGGFYLTDTRYIEEAKTHLAEGAECITVTNSTVFRKINEILDKINAKKVGFENSSITFDSYSALSSALVGKTLVGIEPQLLAIRAVKTIDELKLIKKAASINDRSFAKLLKKVKAGVTERELAYELEYNFRKYGADGTAFDTIVAFGENTSRPHAHISDKKLQLGMPVTIDFGCKYQGYCSDITRSFAFGEPNKQILDIYNAVLNSNLAGINAVKVGMSTRAVDEVCRNYLKQFKLDEYFIHGTGHGVGIDIHEAPTLNPHSDEVLKKNMVITIEPGVYIEGIGGVRIEDLLIVTNDGANVISKTDKKLMIL
ncbi:MAG: aminopeptidase P family protein [Clostridia bacterium]